MATALDANVLLRLAQNEHPLYLVSRNAVLKMQRENETLCYLPQNVAEFWNVLTRSPTARGGFGLTPAQADRRTRRLVVEFGVSGVQVHDARIAACLRVHGVTRLLTFNTKDFVRYSGFTATDPAQV